MKSNKELLHLSYSMSSVFDFFNTLLIGAMTATIYFLNREIVSINDRLEALEDESVFVNESDTETEEEDVDDIEEVKKDN
jgi:hypothetical protein